MSSPQTKVIVLFVEGDTEIEFYKALISHLRKKNKSPFTCNFEYKNMRGVGNYKNDALRRLNDVKSKYPDNEIYAFLCFDTDAFELAKKPPVDMNDVKQKLRENGAHAVSFVKAKKSIEDWFLLDFDGVIKYLRLPAKTPREKGSGQAVLQKLFKKARRVYIKGGNTGDFIDHLNIETIEIQICSALKPLCQCMGLYCKKHNK